jgi:hypothetical protein
MTMILKAEQVAGDSLEELADQKEVIARYMHENSARLNPGWPISRGFKRLLAVEKKAMTPRGYRIEMIMNFCKVRHRGNTGSR